MNPRPSRPRPGRLTERDLKLLVTVYRFRYMSVSQIQEAIAFPSRQTALRRLQFLRGQRFLAGFRIPGIPEQIVALDRKGAELVAEQLYVPVTELLWNAKTKPPRDPWFMRHFLLVGWFRIRLTQGLAHHRDGCGGVELLGFIPEYVGEPKPEGGVKKYLRDVVIDRQTPPRTKLWHTPDAVFALGRLGSSPTAQTQTEKGGLSSAALFFLEIDRGTEVIANPDKGVLKTLRYYLAMMGTDQFQRYAKDFGVTEPFQGFRVLFLTTTPARIANIRTVGGRFPWTPERAKRFIWLAPQTVLQKGSVLGGVWRSLDPGDHGEYGLA